jgi:hypothetical protein
MLPAGLATTAGARTLLLAAVALLRGAAVWVEQGRELLVLDLDLDRGVQQQMWEGSTAKWAGV